MSEGVLHSSFCDIERAMIDRAGDDNLYSGEMGMSGTRGKLIGTFGGREGMKDLDQSMMKSRQSITTRAFRAKPQGYVRILIDLDLISFLFAIVSNNVVVISTNNWRVSNEIISRFSFCP